MKLRTCVGGLAAALIAAGAASAGELDVLYWGKDSKASLVIDGRTYDLAAADDWVAIKDIGPGPHNLTLYANGTSVSRDLTFSNENADSTDGPKGSTWCIDLEDDGPHMLDGDNCEDMMGAYFGE